MPIFFFFQLIPVQLGQVLINQQFSRTFYLQYNEALCRFLSRLYFQR